MADQTHGAVDSLLGVLSSAITDEARLLGGVQGDIQFIKDEMDSMNGFLLHLTKTDTLHDDQLRAWMKQVRDIAYIAQDCIELYTRHLTPPERGLWALVRHAPVLLWTAPARHRLATKIRELKVRVRDVGERRLRYGVSVPEHAGLKPKPLGLKITDDEREEFLRALNEDEASTVSSPSFSKAINMLPCELATEAETEIRDILGKCVPDHVGSMKMLLRALYVYPYGTKEELQNLLKKLNDRAADVPKEVMVFCYSKLSMHYKSCLQYLTAFLKETSISRTSLVRRWVAEGLVARDEELHSMEEAGERCFKELVFRGFIRPAAPVGVTGLKIKSCDMEKSVQKFVVDISASENFVADLPTHLEYQLRIRKIARRMPPEQPPQKPWPWRICGADSGTVNRSSSRNPVAADDGNKLLHPLDELVNLLKNLREEYRLNVLDLGGCTDLKTRHLKSICNVLSLKYLSLRRTDVRRLPRQINNLRQLETLDVRETKLRDTDTERIYLPKLKHLLAGKVDETDELLSTVRMPRRIGRSMEILRHVHILDGEGELEEVGHQKQLRKLGVVLDSSKDNIKCLLRTINKLSECLRSLSVWITPPTGASDGGDVSTLDNMEFAGPTFSPPKNLESLNVKYYRGKGTCGNLPPWLNGLRELSKVTLRDTLLLESGLRNLGKLEKLRCLRLRCRSYTEDVITLKKEEFQNLRFLQVDQVEVIHARIVFEAGAAPKLEKIVWTLGGTTEITADTISGINNLSSLKELELNNCNDPRRHVEQAVAVHPNRPVLRYSCPDSIFREPPAHRVSITGEE